MTMTLLQLVGEFCERTGVGLVNGAQPTSVVSSQDETLLQMRGLLNEGVSDILSRGWSPPDLQKQGNFATVAAELQCTIAVAAPYGFKDLIDGTMYDRTERRMVFGPRSAQDWQESEALPFTGPLYSYRFWQGNIYIQPAPPVGHQVYFEYASDFPISGKTSSTDATVIWKKRFAFDDDTFMLDENLLLKYLRWAWKKEKGLPFVTEKQDYEAILADAMGNDNTKGDLNMAGGARGPIPGIWVPAGNWSI
jgi:hypothetical protein